MCVITTETAWQPLPTRASPLFGQCYNFNNTKMLTQSGGLPRRHQVATTDEEEEMLLALAISASLSENGAAPGPPPAAARPAPAYAPAVQRTGAPPAPAPYATAPISYPYTDTSLYPPYEGYGSSQQQQQLPSAPRPAYPQPYHHPSSSSGTSYAGDARRPVQPSQPAPQPTPAQPQASKPAKPSQSPAKVMHPDKSKCAGCGKAVWLQRLNALDRVWHPECFVCGLCDGEIHAGGTTRFCIGQDDGWPYHSECYALKFNPWCTICQDYIRPQASGRIEYKQQAFWKDAYCSHHSAQSVPQCCSCSRYQPKGTEFPQLTDGRHVCLVCLGSIVTDTNDAQPLYHEVLSYFKHMGMPHPEVAPFMLVDSFTLNEYSDKEGKDTSGGPVFHVRGLTLATVYHSIPSVVRDLGAPGGVSSIVRALPSVKCTVTAVLVLYGLPRLLTGCIMAHELMHAWLRMKHVTGLHPKVEEGLCQLMAYMWLDTQANGLTDPDEQRLASFFSYQIREDLSEVYGDGFRQAYDVFQRKGLNTMINSILRTGHFL